MAINPNGSNRDPLLELAIDRREELIRAGVLVGDPRRWRPRWFDGRFLAAADLVAEQNYANVRQADLARAGGSGVGEGLEVAVADVVDGDEQLEITPGFGITDTGELVALLDPLTFSPGDVAEMKRLDGAFGLQVVPNEAGHSRTGLYVLALRPVEWTANTIGAYPTALTGQRQNEDGSIVEGVAVSLIPYPDKGHDESWERRRARVAREIFVEGRNHGVESGVLPLAMVALNGNLVEWIDTHMVRREVGAERPAGMDFGFGDRALREAHLLQYQEHLAEVLDGQAGVAFPATSHFDAIPPVGLLPSQTVDIDRLTQRFFPPGVEVDVSFVPEDELPALIEESLLLPPIDVTLDAEELAGLGALVLVPLSREDFMANRGKLPDWDAEPQMLRPAYSGFKASASPRELMLSRRFRLHRTPPIVPRSEEAEWRRLLRGALDTPLWWYVRRRHLPLVSNLAAPPVSASRSVDPRRLVRMIRDQPELNERLAKLRRADLPETNLLTRRLAEPRFIRRPALLRSLLARAADAAEPTSDDVIAAVVPAADQKLGEGLERLAVVEPEVARRIERDDVADTGLLADVDKLARDVPENRVRDLASQLNEVVAAGVPSRADLGRRLAAIRSNLVAGPGN